MVNWRLAEVWFFDLISHKQGGTPWCLLCSSVLVGEWFQRLLTLTGSTWNLKAVIQERISMTNFCRLSEPQPARPAIHFTAPADCPLDFWRTRQRSEAEQIPLEQKTTPHINSLLLLLHIKRASQIIKIPSTEKVPFLFLYASNWLCLADFSLCSFSASKQFIHLHDGSFWQAVNRKWQLLS